VIGTVAELPAGATIGKHQAAGLSIIAQYSDRHELAVIAPARACRASERHNILQISISLGARSKAFDRI
jgi:hypothetical protein